ncbi:TauD-domain-containing protein [Mycena sanguinolenta]|uniref:TauD-domain-containing protein n=1 Tax=Mycena sanguinolenta TaxID=230812 RepID=A0A8H6YDM8_9AGAR|nr:TauD-domain-containing protein [Mycena sanguinolenta]
MSYVSLLGRPSRLFLVNLLREERGQGPFETYPYKHLLPEIFPTAETHQPALQDFEHVDPGHRALKHPNPRAFLAGATSISHLTPAIGTEVRGVSLAKLTSDERDELALEVARRGMMIFRGQQDFIDAGGEFWKEFGSHFGRLHVHPTGGYPEGLPEIHMIYRDQQTIYYESDKITSIQWHTDMSHERQPPGLTFFFLLAYPETGGDTLFASGVTALKKLSPAFVSYLRTLKQVQLGVDINVLNRGGKRKRYSRRDCVTTVHPLVRRHPVTGEESLFINPECTQSIVGYKKEESDMLLKFLYNHIASSMESQARVRWEPATVVAWDNRNCLHSALFDYAGTPARRHGARITPQAERPIPADPTLDLSA